MSKPFAARRDRIRVRLSPREEEVLRDLPLLLDSVGRSEGDPAEQRLSPAVYSDDPEANAEWRRFARPELERARTTDRSAFADTLGRDELTAEEAEGWLRTLTEARLVLGVRLGITEDFGSEATASDPMTALLHYLSWLQEELVATLAGGLAAPP